MRRLPVLAALLVAAIIGASAWLAIDARTDPDPLPAAQYHPRDDDQAQQQESQEESDPGPDEQGEEQESAEPEPSDEEATQELREEEETEPTEPLEPRPAPVDVLIKALDVPRPPIDQDLEPAPKTTVVVEFETYVVEPGDTLADIAEQFAIDLHDLIAANQLDSADLLYVGHELTIPIKTSVAEPVPAPAPVEIAPGETEDGVVYGTIRDHERRVVNTAVIFTAQTQAETQTNVRLVEACLDGARRTYLTGHQLTDGPTRIYWRIDNGSLNTDRWQAGAELLESTLPSPILHDIEHAETLWIRVGAVDLVFGVENLGPDEIAHNFKNCGR